MSKAFNRRGGGLKGSYCMFVKGISEWWICLSEKKDICSCFGENMCTQYTHTHTHTHSHSHSLTHTHTHTHRPRVLMLMGMWPSSGPDPARVSAPDQGSSLHRFIRATFLLAGGGGGGVRRRPV